MALLHARHAADNPRGVSCRTLLSVDWLGYSTTAISTRCWAAAASKPSAASFGLIGRDLRQPDRVPTTAMAGTAGRVVVRRRAAREPGPVLSSPRRARHRCFLRRGRAHSPSKCHCSRRDDPGTSRTLADPRSLFALCRGSLRLSLPAPPADAHPGGVRLLRGTLSSFRLAIGRTLRSHFALPPATGSSRRVRQQLQGVNEGIEREGVLSVQLALIP